MKSWDLNLILGLWKSPMCSWEFRGPCVYLGLCAGTELCAHSGKTWGGSEFTLLVNLEFVQEQKMKTKAILSTAWMSVEGTSQYTYTHTHISRYNTPLEVNLRAEEGRKCMLYQPNSFWPDCFDPSFPWGRTALYSPLSFGADCPSKCLWYFSGRLYAHMVTWIAPVFSSCGASADH